MTSKPSEAKLGNSDLIENEFSDSSPHQMMQKQLYEQKAYAEKLLNIIPSAVYTVDEQQRITGWNKMAALITGYTEVEIMGKPCTYFAVSPCREFCGLLSREIPKPLTNKICSIQNKAGEILYISKNLDVIRNETGDVVGGIECFYDITETIRIEQELRESEERYSAIVNSAPQIIVIHRQGIIIFINDAGLNASKYSREEIIGKNVFHFLTDESQKIAYKAMEKRELGESVDDYEIEFIVKSGMIHTLIVISTLITFEKAPASLVVLVDITERKKIERELNSKERILNAVALAIKFLLGNRNFFEAIENGFELLGKAMEVDRIYLFKNESDVNGLSNCIQKIEWNLGKQNSKLAAPEFQSIPSEIIDNFIKPLEQHQPICGIVREFSDGQVREMLQERRILSTLALPVFVREKFWGFVGVEECKYERQWTEGEFSSFSAFGNALEKAIERSMIEEELELAKKTAETANTLKNQFLANMSHEIRTPMNGIIGFLELLNRTNLSSVQRDYIREVKSASEILLVLINDILDFSKIEAGKLSIDKIDFKLRTAIDDAVSLIAPRAHEKQLELLTLIKSNVPEDVVGDPARLRQVLNNLLSNAIKFTEKGEIILTVETVTKNSEEARIAFHVKDTGIGISNEIQKILFKPFIQADASTTRKYGGTGLGLAISYELVKMMKGEIEVESELGQGSIFTFKIPFQISSPHSDSGFEFHLLKDTRIMVVDDHLNNRMILKSYLEEVGCKIFEAQAPEEAMSTIISLSQTSERIHLVLADYQMPGMTGYELANALRAIPFLKNIKLILLTSAAQKGDAKIANELGFSGYLSKPVKRMELLNMVSIVMGFKEEEPLHPFVTRYSIKEALDSHKPYILLVEDNDMNRKIIVTMLNENGIACDVAIDGQEGLYAIQEKNYDIVLMDCQMPVMDGYQTTERIREWEAEEKHTVIIAMTANAMEGDREKCIQAGMDEYISKPIDFDRLFELIRKYALQNRNQAEHFKLENCKLKMSSSSRIKKEKIDILFQSYLDTLPEKLDQIENALNSNAFEQVQFIAHQIKGSSSMLYLDKLQKLSTDMELAASFGDNQKCRDLLRQMKNKSNSWAAH